MYLAIDLGTSSVKTLLMDEEKKVVFQASCPLTLERIQPLYVEQDPKDWWDATKNVLQKIPETYKNQITHIGLTGQMHAPVLLDKQGSLLRRAILWNDGRCFQECTQLAAMVPDYKILTSNLLMPGFTAPKLLWIKKHEPQVFSKIAKILLPKDYLRYRLTGIFATDLSDASGTSCLDITKRRWSNTMIGACGIEEDYLPELFEGPEITGTLDKNIAQELGLSKTVKVIAGASDNAASGLSAGCINERYACLSLGTSGVYFTAREEPIAKPEKGVHTYCHALPDLWHQMSVHLSSASCFSFLENLFEEPISSLMEKCSFAKKKSSCLVFLPYLSGERTPYNDPYAKGVFFGLDHKTSKADIVQAVMEGTAFACKQGQDKLNLTNINTVTVLGGGAKNGVWMETLAAVLQKSLQVYSNGHLGAAYGVAKLARFAALKTDLEEAFSCDGAHSTIFKQQNDHYKKKERIFHDLYPALRNIYQMSAE